MHSKIDLDKSTPVGHPGDFQRDVENCHVTAIRRASRNLTRIYDSKLAPMGLKSTQRALLLHIAARPGITITKLSALTLVDKSALKRNLGPMQRQGYVTINVSPEDARSRSLAVTAKGQDLLSKSRRAWLEAQELYEDSVGSDDALEIKTLMRLVANISEPGVERTGVKT